MTEGLVFCRMPRKHKAVNRMVAVSPEQFGLLQDRFAYVPGIHGFSFPLSKAWMAGP
jgi:hypothetical protein